MLGSTGLGGGEQRRVVDREVAVVVLYDGQSRPLNTGKEEEEDQRGKPGQLYCQCERASGRNVRKIQHFSRAMLKRLKFPAVGR